MSKQRKDNWEMIKAHRTAQEEILKKIMETAQVWPQVVLERQRLDNSNSRRLKNDQFFSPNKKAQQLKELEASFVAATKEMQSAQAKMAVETAKEVSPPASQNWTYYAYTGSVGLAKEAPSNQS